MCPCELADITSQTSSSNTQDPRYLIYIIRRHSRAVTSHVTHIVKAPLPFPIRQCSMRAKFGSLTW